MTDHQRIKLLISVRDEREAEDALAGGADWIDLKEPGAGPLGPVPLSTAQQVVKVVSGRCQISAAMGELVEWPFSDARQLVSVSEISVVKLGLAGCANKVGWQKLWSEAFQYCHQAGKNLAAVIYADWAGADAPPPSDVLTLAINVGCKYLLIDTFNKKSVSSLTALSLVELVRIAEIARGHGMLTVLAGNLRSSDFTQIVDLPIEMVAVRGAACLKGRTSRIDRELVRQLRNSLAREMGSKTITAKN